MLYKYLSFCVHENVFFWCLKLFLNSSSSLSKSISLSSKKVFSGLSKSETTLYLLWVIKAGDKNVQGPKHRSFSCKACSIGIKASYYPCTMKVGQVTRCILLRLSNLSYRRFASTPTLLFATLLIEMNGEISIKLAGSYFAARCVAGPLPRDLPMTKISCCFNFAASWTKL